MIISKIVDIDGDVSLYTYSDEGRYVVRDGVSYEEAYDPVDSGRTYTEGDFIPIEEDESQQNNEAEEILDILLGGII